MRVGKCEFGDVWLLGGGGRDAPSTGVIDTGAMPVSPEHDRRVRQEAMAWLTIRTNDGRDAISTQDLGDFNS